MLSMPHQRLGQFRSSGNRTLVKFRCGWDFGYSLGGGLLVPSNTIEVSRNHPTKVINSDLGKIHLSPLVYDPLEIQRQCPL